MPSKPRPSCMPSKEPTWKRSKTGNWRAYRADLLPGDQWDNISGQMMAWCEEFGIYQVLAIFSDTMLMKTCPRPTAALSADTLRERAIKLHRYETFEAAITILSPACDQLREWLRSHEIDETHEGSVWAASRLRALGLGPCSSRTFETKKGAWYVLGSGPSRVLTVTRASRSQPLGRQAAGSLVRKTPVRLNAMKWGQLIVDLRLRETRWGLLLQKEVVGLRELESLTSSVSRKRSNQLSYRPKTMEKSIITYIDNLSTASMVVCAIGWYTGRATS